jgi:hypothetical protein
MKGAPRAVLFHERRAARRIYTLKSAPRTVELRLCAAYYGGFPRLAQPSGRRGAPRAVLFHERRAARNFFSPQGRSTIRAIPTTVEKKSPGTRREGLFR